MITLCNYDNTVINVSDYCNTNLADLPTLSVFWYDTLVKLPVNHWRQKPPIEKLQKKPEPNSQLCSRQQLPVSESLAWKKATTGEEGEGGEGVYGFHITFFFSSPSEA